MSKNCWRSIDRKLYTYGETASRLCAKCGITACANSSWFLIAIQCGAPPALTVIPISLMPSQTRCVVSMRSMISAGVPTQT
jgi:hypothetical protein